MFKDSIGGKKTKLNHVLKYLKSNISANLHILVDLSKVPQSFFDFLKTWNNQFEIYDILSELFFIIGTAIYLEFIELNFLDFER